jgi:APA family basic amino acid/polyamine antiporter
VPRTFRTPLVPIVPLVGIGFSIWLIASLEPVTWLRFAAWMALGFVVYFAYSRRRSVLARGVTLAPSDLGGPRQSG